MLGYLRLPRSYVARVTLVFEINSSLHFISLIIFVSLAFERASNDAALTSSVNG